jgi:hypothetical protein
LDGDGDGGVNGIVIGEEGVGPFRGGEEGLVSSSDKEVNGVTKEVSRKGNMLGEVEGREKGAEGSRVIGTIEMDVEITGDDKVRGGCAG